MKELDNTKNDYTLSINDLGGSCNSSIIMVMQPNFIGEEEQEQPQSLELDNLYEYDPHSEAISSSITVMQLDFIGEEEQQLPQILNLDDNVYETFSEASSSMDMQLLQALQLENEGNESHFKQNMQMEETDVQQQQQSNASYDPILTHIAYSNYFSDVSDELFPSLWSY